MGDRDIYARTTRNRLEIAEFLESLSPVQWGAETLCQGWTVQHMAAHLVQPMLIGFGQFFLTAMRYRGNTAATVDHFTRSIAYREPANLVALLRRHAAEHLNPPRVGPFGPFADTCIHLRDIARPLNLDADARHEDWLDLLAYLTSGRAAAGLIAAHRIEGIRLTATDADFHRGSGAEVTGTLEALTMAITGRQSAVADLNGPGAAVLRARLQKAEHP